MKNKIVPIIFIASFLAILAVYIFSPGITTVLIQILYTVFSLAAALIGVYAARIYRFNSATGRAIILIAGGLVCWGIAETIWTVTDNLIEGGITSPSIADFLFLLAYPIFGAGIYQGFITAGIKIKQVKKSLLVMLLLASIILTIFVAYFGMYQAYDPDTNLLNNVVNIFYGFVDLILVIASLLTILVAREYGGGKLASFWKAMALGFFLVLLADILFAMYWDFYWEDLKPYVYIDLFWLAGYLAIAYGMLQNYLHVTEVQKKIKLMIQQRSNPTEV